MQGGISKKIGLFLLIFGIPLSFLYLLANGKANINKLKFYGQEITDVGKYKINDFTFYDIDSNIVNKETLKGKTIITSILIPSCPSLCPIISQQLNEFVYKKVIKDSKLSDFVILSQFIDTTNKKSNLDLFLTEQDIDPERWFIVKGKENPIYNIDFNVQIKNYSIPWYKRLVEKKVFKKRNLINDDTPRDSALGKKTYHSMILLIDKNHYLRGIYQGNKTQDIERLRKEVRVLQTEYRKEKQNKK